MLIVVSDNSCDWLCAQMLKMFFLNPIVSCSMFAIGCFVSVVVCAILRFVCLMFMVWNRVCSVGYLDNYFCHPHNSVSYNKVCCPYCWLSLLGYKVLDVMVGS